MMPKVDLSFAFKQPPEKAVAYFKSLGLPVPDETVVKAVEFNARQKAFMVAGVGKADVLADIHNEVGKYIEGGTMRDAKKNLERILTEKGWWTADVKKDKDGGHVFDKDGVSIGRKLNPRRVDIILRQNKISAFSAARYDKLMLSRETRPWWRYNTRLDNRVRASHRVLHGLTFRVDDPFWDTFYPPIDWLCRCFVTCHSERDITREGWQDELRDTVADDSLTTHEKRYSTRLREARSAPVTTYKDPKRVDYQTRKPVQVTTGVGFNNNPANDWIETFTPKRTIISEAVVDAWRVKVLDPEKNIRPYSAYLPKGKEGLFYAETFLGRFGATVEKGVIFKDVTGTPLAVGVSMILDRKSNTLKVTKRGREVYLNFLADTVIDPDEIWLYWDYNKRAKGYLLERRYFKAFMVEHEGQVEYGLCVFRFAGDAWEGVTGFHADDDTALAKALYIDTKRKGLLMHKK